MTLLHHLRDFHKSSAPHAVSPLVTAVCLRHPVMTEPAGNHRTEASVPAPPLAAASGGKGGFPSQALSFPLL